MSKRTTAAKFRNVNVDEYNDDNFEDEGETGAAGPDAGDTTALTDSELSALLADGKTNEALAALLARPPVNSRNPAVKEQAAAQVLRVLMQTKAGDIERCVQAVDESQLDTLMKYVYRSFELAKENHIQLLTWHEKVLARGQIGCIVRVLADRKRV